MDLAPASLQLAIWASDNTPFDGRGGVEEDRQRRGERLSLKNLEET